MFANTVDLIANCFNWMPVPLALLAELVVSAFLTLVVINLVIKIVDMIPFL